MTKESRQQAVTVIINVLKAIHQKEYQHILDCVDDSEENDIEMLFHFIQETLRLNGFGTIDEYGIPCHFHPAYKYEQLRFYEFDDNSGFAAEYDLTSDSELVDLCLQMKFLYQKSGLKSVFVTIDPQ